MAERVWGAITQGVGAERTCELVGHWIIHERWVAWDEGRSFTCEGSGIPLVNRTANRWSALPHGDKSLLTSEAEVEMKGGLFGRLCWLQSASDPRHAARW
jgi:hypothetical protein